jgi:uncharacterized protein YkwD
MFHSGGTVWWRPTIVSLLIFVFMSIFSPAFAGGGATLPFLEDFEGGSLGSYWTTASTGTGRILVTTVGAPYRGGYYLTMDAARGGVYSLNELVLTVDLAGKSGVILAFYHKTFRDENHRLPNRFSGSYRGDGVAVSPDGTTWYKVQGLTARDGTSAQWTRFEVDLDAAAAAAGIAYNSAFKIKFQQYDNYPIATDGFAFDDIEVYQAMVDSDGDGLPDDWERAHFGELVQGPDGDYDTDGVSNLDEFQGGTDPGNSDTDGDRMPDGWELQFGLNPLDPADAAGDLDGDGLKNLDEYVGGTDPTVANVSAAAAPFYEDFEGGLLGAYWTATSSGGGRIQVTSANGPMGRYHLTMDSASSGSYGLNELVLTIDLTGQSGIVLSFYHKEFRDEDHAMPSSFLNSCNGDGVAVSADGRTWYRVQGLTGADGIGSDWRRYQVDLDAATAAAGIAYNSTFKIKFQQYDNYPIGTDGFAFDEIEVAAGQPAEPPADPGQDDLAAQERELVELINQERAKLGLAALQVHDGLVAAARRHSTDMAQNNFLSHTGSDGSSPWDRMRDAGYQLTYGGENVAAGYPTARGVVDGWLNSPGHRDNMLNPNFCEMGVGYAYGPNSSYGHYWTLTLGCR